MQLDTWIIYSILKCNLIYSIVWVIIQLNNVVLPWLLSASLFRTINRKYITQPLQTRPLPLAKCQFCDVYGCIHLACTWHIDTTDGVNLGLAWKCDSEISHCRLWDKTECIQTARTKCPALAVIAFFVIDLSLQYLPDSCPSVWCTWIVTHLNELLWSRFLSLWNVILDFFSTLS